MQDVVFTFLYKGKKLKHKLSEFKGWSNENVNIKLKGFGLTWITDGNGNINPNIKLLNVDITQKIEED